MIKIRLCCDCWQRVSPLLGRAAFDEREHMLEIARKIRTCRNPGCRLEAERLKLAALKNTFEKAAEQAAAQTWQWLEDTFGKE